MDFRLWSKSNRRPKPIHSIALPPSTRLQCSAVTCFGFLVLKSSNTAQRIKLARSMLSGSPRGFPGNIGDWEQSYSRLIT